MPSSTTSIELLTRNTQLTDDEWLALVEKRRELVRPLLDRFTLRELGDVPCVHGEKSRYYPLGFHVPELAAEERFSLKTQAIFGHISWDTNTYIPNSGYRPPPGGVSRPDGSRKFWGLTRSNEWIIVVVRFKGHAGYKGRGAEHAERVEISSVDISTLLAEAKVSADEVWDTLGRTIKEWEHVRLRAYEQLHSLAERVRMEDMLIRTNEELTSSSLEEV